MTSEEGGRSAPPPRPTRRGFLVGAATAAVAGPLLGLGRPGCSGSGGGPVRPELPDGLFALGVASGDPRPDAVVLWTRLAPAPLAGGGMPAVDVPVRWEVAHDERFRRIARRGTVTASPGHGHAVHVDVRHLRPGTWYFYRFLVGDQASPVGRTRTAPPPGSDEGLRFLAASCQSWKDGFWPLWAHAPADEPDLVVFLGDYIYEGGTGNAAVGRDHDGPEIRTLDEYRNRYGLYKGDPALQAAHAACPWVVTRDDHEVENNYAGLVPENPAEAPAFAARRAAAYQAWWEHQPVRLPPPDGPGLRIHRALEWGRLARLHVLDGRQHRSDQVCDPLGTDCADRAAPERTMLGADQEAWLGRSLRRSRARWNLLANQTVMTSMPLAGTLRNHDQWDGYPAARSRVLDQLRTAANPVVLTGDIHALGVADVVDEAPGSPAVATELVASSISSRFSPSLADAAEALLAELPQIRWSEIRRRGYLCGDVTRDALVARFRTVESVAVPDAPVTTVASWTVTAGVVGAQPA